MTKRFFKRPGFSDLLAFFLAILLLFFLVYTRYEAFSCRSMQSEAKFYLKEIFLAQKIYFKEHATFAPLSTLKKLHLVSLPENYYIFNEVALPNKESFLIGAQGKTQTLVSGDTWSVNEKEQIVNTENACQKK